MDKFLEEVKNNLKGLSEKDIEKEINNLKASLKEDNNLDSKTLADSILLKYNKKENYFKRKINDLVSTFNHLVDIMGKNDFQANLKIVGDILILLIFVSLCKIPFIVVRNVGDSLLKTINIPIVYNIWALLVELVYLVIAIMILVNVFPKWFKKLEPSNNSNKVKETPVKVKEEPQKIGNDLESISLTEQDKTKEDSK